MNDSVGSSGRVARIAAWFSAVLLLAATVAGIAWYLVRSTPVEDPGLARAVERKRLWTEIQGQNSDALGHYAVLKADTGVYRLPIDRAIEITAAEWRDGNPGGRAKLLKRLEASQKAPTFE